MTPFRTDWKRGSGRPGCVTLETGEAVGMPAPAGTAQLDQPAPAGRRGRRASSQFRPTCHSRPAGLRLAGLRLAAAPPRLLLCPPPAAPAGRRPRLNDMNARSAVVPATADRAPMSFAAVAPARLPALPGAVGAGARKGADEVSGVRRGCGARAVRGASGVSRAPPGRPRHPGICQVTVNDISLTYPITSVTV
jgi:hypothetical protein